VCNELRLDAPVTDAALNTLSATEIAAGTQAGTFSCEQIACACIERVSERETAIKAWEYFEPNNILRQARALDQRIERGPLHGVPIGVKDIIDTVDMPTQMGSVIYRGHRSKTDASCVAMLRAAGALIFGKTVTCEFAGATAGVTTNPCDQTRTPGGSSSGSAAAVADFMVPLALGTQTGGSIHRPASFCGAIGYKPTFGLISRAGIKLAAESLDTVGLIGRTIEDIALAARVLRCADEIDWLSATTRVRVGICRTPNWDNADDSTKDAIESAARKLAMASFDLHEISLSDDFKELTMTREIMNDFERARSMSYEWLEYRSDISAGLAKTIENGLTVSRERYAGAVRRVQECRQQLAPVFNDVDVLLTPAVNGEAPLGLAYTGDHRFQSIWTQLHVPTLSVPTHKGAMGLPVSIQLVGAAFRDTELLAIAKLLNNHLCNSV
jgi:Asp-tRNA(Asn)/Glu-tRNA(Gln) amidotransferase A subunit family amidase